MDAQRDYRGERENYEALERDYEYLEGIQAATVERAERAEDELADLKERHERANKELDSWIDDAVNAYETAALTQERANSWLEAAKFFCRVAREYRSEYEGWKSGYLALESEMLELKRALRTLGGNRD